uniref:Glutamate rich 2 n=2 Tax=Equus asinus TaxID=9793 RepID=A0A9L0IZI4_EQUAS
MAGVRGPQAGSGSAAPRLPRRRTRSFGLEFCIPEIPRNYLDKTDAIKVGLAKMQSLQSRRKLVNIAFKILMISCPNQQMTMVKNDTNDEDNDEDSTSNKDTHAPLELMAEFLRAEMSQDYHLAKKLCQMILIYEPENPEAKEFFSLIEEMLLMEKTQTLEEDDEDSEEDSSGESEGESSEDLSEESSDECEDE